MNGRRMRALIVSRMAVVPAAAFIVPSGSPLRRCLVGQDVEI